MSGNKVRPAPSEAALRERVVKLLGRPSEASSARGQLKLDFITSPKKLSPIQSPASSVRDFLDFVSAAMPDGDVYLFGGLLRDLALYGRKGFSSDVDVVVEGGWERLQPYLESLGARKNKFGGYRLSVETWPIDIWHAPETWAVKSKLIKYEGIASLTETTVLNWDAILMNWRTRGFIYRRNYFEELFNRDLDLVLLENPNPLGMAVRVLRHMCQKDAVRVSTKAAVYLANCAKAFEFDLLKSAEIGSYGNSLIEPKVHEYFRILNGRGDNLRQEFRLAASIISPQVNLAI